MPDLSYEKQYSNYKYIIGLDEVGRGPWAGPVVACAAIIKQGTTLPDTIKDSKKLTDKKRRDITIDIADKVDYHLGQVEPATIDKINILQATFLAMYKAVEGLKEKLNIQDDEYFVLIDGNKIPPFDIFKNSQAIVKGDDKSLSIACGAIIAKVYRDDLMIKLALENPGYAWESNSGYGTKAHQEGLAKLGVCEHHRKSFKPIANIINA